MIENIRIEPLKSGKFIKPVQINYRHDGKDLSWEAVQAHDSVAVLLYHREYECFLLVKQFRPPVYLNNSDGYTYELCAGIVDKPLSLKEIAKEEVLEECGYELSLDGIEKITTFYTSVGFAGSKQTLYFAEVDESMHTQKGGGVGVESIEVVKLPLKDAKDFIYNESYAKTPGLMFAFMWFFSKNGSDF
jgi:UDP-sugar diphosphatase